VDREPRRGRSGSSLTVEITQPLRTTKRSGGTGAAPSSRWRPVLSQRLSRFVSHHRQKWDVVMAILTIVYRNPETNREQVLAPKHT
jgi:hypothetical protein